MNMKRLNLMLNREIMYKSATPVKLIKVLTLGPKK